MKHSKTRQPDKPNPLLNLYLWFAAVGELERAGVSEYRTEQDGDRCHHAAAEGEGDATGCVGTLGWFDGNVEIERVEDPSSTQKRRQDRQESRNAPRAAALTLAAALSTIRGLLCGLEGLHPALRAPHHQLHALRGRAYQRSTLVHGAVHSGGFWAASCGVYAVGKVSVRGRGGAADAVFCGGVHILPCDDVGTGAILILLLLFRDICSWRLWEAVCGLMITGSRACWNQIRSDQFRWIHYSIPNSFLKKNNLPSN